jgi:putative ABC transport system ATP-binding protein
MRVAGLQLVRKASPRPALSALLGLESTARFQNAVAQHTTRAFATAPGALARPTPWGSVKSIQSRPCPQTAQIAARLSSKFSTTPPRLRETPTNATKDPQVPQKEAESTKVKTEEFAPSEKASRAGQLNLSAKLSRDGRAVVRKYPVASELWRLVKIAGPESKALMVAFTLLLLSSSVTLAVPWTIGKIMDQANNPEGKISMFGLEPSTFYLCFGGLLALGAASNFGRLILLRTIGERVVARLRTNLYRRTMTQNAEFFDANRVGDLISRLGADTSIVGKSITSNLSDGLRALVSGSAGLGMMFWVSPHLTSVLFVMLPAFATSAIVFGRAIRNLSRTVQKSIGDLTKIAEERLGNVKTVQAFVGEAPEVGRYSHQVKKLFQLGKRDAILNAAYFGTNGFLANMMILALLYIGGGMVQSGAITLGQLSSFLLYSAYTGSSMFGLSSFYSELMKGSGAASRLFELQDRHPPVYPSVGENVRDAKGEIEFKNVKFSYPTRPGLVIFNDLTFKIEEGKNYAIVAPSGAGKSTVASLLLRFYEVNSGTITIAGRDVSKMNSQQLRRKIGYVGQEPVLFSGSIAENIAYGRPWATLSEIREAVEKANCGFIKDFVSSSTWDSMTNCKARHYKHPSRCPWYSIVWWPETTYCYCSCAHQRSRYSHSR